nr:condensation domain-containing protein [Flavobacterium sp. N502536]
MEFSLVQENYSDQSASALSEYLQEQQATVFDLTTAPLLKAVLLKTDEKEYVLSLVIHHAIGDGWSLEVMFAEIVAAYNNLIHGKSIDLPADILQYKDYAVWQQSQENEKSVLDSEAYWLSVFKGDLPVLELPSYRSRPARQTYKGNTLSYSFRRLFWLN